MGNNCTKTVQIFPISEYRRSQYSSSRIQKYNNDEKKQYYSNNIFKSNSNLINMVGDQKSQQSIQNVEPTIHRQRSVHFAESEYNNNKFVQKAIELDSRQFSELLDSEKNNKKIEELNTDNEIIENIIRHLMRTKIMIDGCTFDESRRNYSIVPFVYLD